MFFVFNVGDYVIHILTVGALFSEIDCHHIRYDSPFSAVCIYLSSLVPYETQFNLPGPDDSEIPRKFIIDPFDWGFAQCGKVERSYHMAGPHCRTNHT